MECGRSAFQDGGHNHWVYIILDPDTGSGLSVVLQQRKIDSVKLTLHIREIVQEAFHVYLNKFEITVTHLCFVLLCKS